ncbi:hypothetical protein GGX14DRAFT_701962 [Mycena pura]|uniref:G domain-containing protein n=1 Tax=Mycena pura TaxID=153505 RepID=A0AAD6UKR1_9AGAR|nr:hypothetical protein GGX14DRAFT_701962 [Mycena pura]
MTTQPDAVPFEMSKTLVQCPEFNLLVVGTSKVGKSSLIRHAFGIEMNAVSHRENRKLDLNNGLRSMQNPRFTIHEFTAYHPQELQNPERENSFLRLYKGDNIPLKDQLHAVWICIPVPSADLNKFHAAVEALLKLTKVPAVVVFTCFDLLTRERDLEISDSDDVDMEKLYLERANAKFKEICVNPLTQINPNLPYTRTSGLRKDTISNQEKAVLATLVQTTRDLIEQHIERQLWTASVTNHGKFNTSVKIGMKRYYSGLASSANFSLVKLDRCLEKSHRQITRSWEFDDPYVRLNHRDFMHEIRDLAQAVSTDAVEETSSYEYLERFQVLVALVLGTTVAATVGPVAAGMGLLLWFIQKIARVYYTMPETLRCFMEYIVDLTLVLDQLSHIVLSRPPRALTKEDVETAVARYQNSTAAAQVHSELQTYADCATLAQILQRNRAEEKMTELVTKYHIQPEMVT